MKAIIGATVIIVLLIGGFAYYRDFQAKKERHDSAVATARHLDDADTRIGPLLDARDAAFAKYNRDSDAAVKASHRRHDAGVNNNLTDEDGLAFAKDEQAHVAALGDDIRAMFMATSNVADFFDSVYGASSVKSLRDDSQKLQTSQELGQDKWDRAVSDIVDFFEQREHGVYTIISPDVERYYEESGEEFTRSEPLLTRVQADGVALINRLGTDRRKADLAAR